MDGTASLANRDFGRVARANGPKVAFSGAAQHANERAGAGYFADSTGESAATGTRWRSGVDSNSRFRWFWPENGRFLPVFFLRVGTFSDQRG
jgi:hypothetical protein